MLGEIEGVHLDRLSSRLIGDLNPPAAEACATNAGHMGHRFRRAPRNASRWTSSPRTVVTAQVSGRGRAAGSIAGDFPQRWPPAWPRSVTASPIHTSDADSNR